MNRIFQSLAQPLANDRGSALLVMVLLVPVLTLFVVFASSITYQDTTVTINDNCHRGAFLNADAALYGTAKMIGFVGKKKAAPEIISGVGGDAPGVIFNNQNADKDIGFRQMVTSLRSKDSLDEYDVEFIKVPGSDIGLLSIVDIEKMGTPDSVGGGAEFGAAAEGVGAQLNKALFRIRSQGSTDNCRNTTAMVEGDYYMVASDTIGEKGI